MADTEVEVVRAVARNGALSAPETMRQWTSKPAEPIWKSNTRGREPERIQDISYQADIYPPTHPKPYN